MKFLTQNLSFFNLQFLIILVIQIAINYDYLIYMCGEKMSTYINLLLKSFNLIYLFI